MGKSRDPNLNNKNIDFIKSDNQQSEFMYQSLLLDGDETKIFENNDDDKINSDNNKNKDQSLNLLESDPHELENTPHSTNITSVNDPIQITEDGDIADWNIKNNAVMKQEALKPSIPKQETILKAALKLKEKINKPVVEKMTNKAVSQENLTAYNNQGLEIHNIGKKFKKRPVLSDVSLNVKRGEVVGLLGPNGAGKTTCFYMISGLISTEQGKITLDGQDITGLPMYRRSRLGIGYLPQESSIFRGLNVEENIMAILEIVEKNKDLRHASLDRLLDEFSITHLRKTPSVALSGGERRRMEIARSLASNPNFILLDEPLAGIDPNAVGDNRKLVGNLKERGIGVLITDHNVRETLAIVDRAYILHEGRVLMEGVPELIVKNEEVRRVYLGKKFKLEDSVN